MIQDGQHLLNCLRYVHLNMVRAGEVDHPLEWRWCGYDELIGKRKRYRLLNVERLLQSLDLDDPQDLARLHADGVADRIACRHLAKEAFWSESLAVGSREYIENVKKLHRHRSRFDEESVPVDTQPDIWTVRETCAPHMADYGRKSTS